jgi:hypothetical protein
MRFTNARAIIHCSFSTSSEIWNGAPCADEAQIAPQVWKDGAEASRSSFATRGAFSRLYFWGDAGVANPVIYDYLEANGSNTRSTCPCSGVSAGFRLVKDAKFEDPCVRSGSHPANPGLS